MSYTPTADFQTAPCYNSHTVPISILDTVHIYIIIMLKSII